MATPGPSPEAPVALITGAGSGIGRAIALQLARLGYRLVLVGRRPEPLQSVAAELGPHAAALCVTADAGDPARIRSAVDRAVDHFGRIDVLVNNAGYAPLLPIDQTSPEVLEECFHVNAIGPASAIARAWPYFQAQRSGCIVNISTMGTDEPFEGFFAYAAAKASVNLMAKSCAKEGRAHNIRAFAVAPGAVETPMLRGLFPASKLPPENCLAPADVARVVVECITGVRNADNGMTIFLPSP